MCTCNAVKIARITGIAEGILQSTCPTCRCRHVHAGMQRRQQPGECVGEPVSYRDQRHVRLEACRPVCFGRAGLVTCVGRRECSPLLLSEYILCPSVEQLIEGSGQRARPFGSGLCCCCCSPPPPPPPPPP